MDSRSVSGSTVYTVATSDNYINGASAYIQGQYRAPRGIDSSNDVRVSPHGRPTREMAARKNVESTEEQLAREQADLDNLRFHYGRGVHQRAGGVSPTPFDNGAVTPGGKRRVPRPGALSGDYDPVTLSWREEPTDPEYLDREARRTYGDGPIAHRTLNGGYHPNVGKYDFLKHEEEIPPAMPQYEVRDITAQPTPGKRILPPPSSVRATGRYDPIRGVELEPPPTPPSTGKARPSSARTDGSGAKDTIYGGRHDPEGAAAHPPGGAGYRATPGKRVIVPGGVPASQVVIGADETAPPDPVHTHRQRRHGKPAYQPVGSPYGLDEPAPPPQGWRLRSPFATGYGEPAESVSSLALSGMSLHGSAGGGEFGSPVAGHRRAGAGAVEGEEEGAPLGSEGYGYGYEGGRPADLHGRLCAVASP